MDYQQMCDDVAQLDFIANQEQADHAIKAVLGILASRLDDDDARRLTEDLPEPLTIDALRGMQRKQLKISFDEYIAELSTQFHVTEDQARQLVQTVYRDAKDSVDPETVSELRSHLPPDWAQTLAAA